MSKSNSKFIKKWDLVDNHFLSLYKDKYSDGDLFHLYVDENLAEDEELDVCWDEIPTFDIDFVIIRLEHIQEEWQNRFSLPVLKSIVDEANVLVSIYS